MTYLYFIIFPLWIKEVVTGQFDIHRMVSDHGRYQRSVLIFYSVPWVERCRVSECTMYNGSVPARGAMKTTRHHFESVRLVVVMLPGCFFTEEINPLF